MKHVTKKWARYTVGTVAILVVFLCVQCTKEAADPTKEVHAALETMKAAEGDKVTIQKFAQDAAAANIQSMVQAFDSTMQKTAGPTQMHEFLANTIVPFFGDFRRVDTYETVAPASLPDGRVGTVHYTYIENDAGRKKPITIVLIRDGTRVVVVNVIVGECVKDRHPVSEGRCSS